MRFASCHPFSKYFAKGLCKNCYSTKNRDRSYHRKYNAKRRQDPDVVKKEKEYYREWYAKNGRNRAIDYREAIYEWIKRNPEKVKAKRLIAEAIRLGKIIKPKYCVKCRRETRLSGHHFDYNKPLEVLWLCSSCHKKEHTSNLLPQT